MNRRAFVQTLVKGAVGAGVGWGFPRGLPARISPNEKIVVALIGCGGMGNHHLGNLLARNDVQVAAVCDAYVPRYADAAKRAGGSCAGYQDYRRILDRNDIDAVWIATPDHWHALMAIHSCQAWKDVYVEKPLTTTVYEGRKMVEAARRYGRIVQVGIQQRSMEVYWKAIEILRSGAIGTVTTVRTWLGPNGNPGYETREEPPEGLDWELWLGPAPWVPFSPQRFHNFRGFDDYAGGELTNWGPHLVDIALWGMGEDRPLAVQGHGGSYRSLTGGDHETVEAIWEFPGATLTWSQGFHEIHQGKGYGTQFQGTKGRLTIDRRSLVVEPPYEGKSEWLHPSENYYITVEEHHTDFLGCMRSRRPPRADIETGHRATSACLLANIAIDCERKLIWDGDRERFIADEAADRHLHRPYRVPWYL